MSDGVFWRVKHDRDNNTTTNSRLQSVMNVCEWMKRNDDGVCCVNNLFLCDWEKKSRSGSGVGISRILEATRESGLVWGGDFTFILLSAVVYGASLTSQGWPRSSICICCCIDPWVVFFSLRCVMLTEMSLIRPILFAEWRVRFVRQVVKMELQELLLNVHSNLEPPKPDGSTYLMNGNYHYYHYGCDGFQDVVSPWMT